jgi:putative ABC transport system permease protein
MTMSLWSRIANVLRGRRLDRDIDEEFEGHWEEARAHGRPAGSRLRTREAVRDAIVAGWLESLLADAVFGWRQLGKRKAASAAAVLSLALGIGSCTAAFRLIDALFLRPLPVADPGSLYVVGYGYTNEHGVATTGYSMSYPAFRRMRESVQDQAEMLAIEAPARMDVTYGSDDQMERAYRQLVSGWTFGVFGLQPALGRLLTESDDVKPGAAPYAVLSYDYWARRFGKDPKVIGRRFRMGNTVLEVIGVAPKGFTGTEPE